MKDQNQEFKKANIFRIKLDHQYFFSDCLLWRDNFVRIIHDFIKTFDDMYSE